MPRRLVAPQTHKAATGGRAPQTPRIPPPIDVHKQILELIYSGRPVAMAVILHAEGSTPQKAAARAIIDESGRIWGTLGGGAVEAEAQRRGVEVCKSKRPTVFDFHLDSADAEDASAICGGSMRILIAPPDANHRACYAQVVEAVQNRRRGVLLTEVHSAGLPGMTVDVRWIPQQSVPQQSGFPDAGALTDCLLSEKPQLLVTDSRDPAAAAEVLLEPVIPRPLLLIAGGGHVGQALARQATLIGFDVTVLDDRPEFTRADLFPDGVALRCGPITKQVADFAIDFDTYIVLVTRGHQHDAKALEACIHSRAAYIGMIGSRRKVASIRQSFLQSGLATAAEFDRVFAPIGLDIGARTVPEIATAIAAEMIAVRRGAVGRNSLADRSSTDKTVR